MTGFEFKAEVKKGTEITQKPIWLNKNVVTLIQPDEKDENKTLVFTTLTDRAFMVLEPYSTIVKRVEH